ncbi:SMI1/KNR4 family protein [Streptomyces sp. NPDC048420]|uniref:SMI1/KNR4 family protein n=1 Tax=Streptomyces sp. NPDC048420 TaxID=3155755 RepID=UPI00342882F3
MAMSHNFTDSVIRMLGPAGTTPTPEAAWEDVEVELGVQLPGDYKQLVADYAPVQLNYHLFLHHPSTERWNLGRWMRETVDAFSHSDLTDAECPGFPDGPRFGGPIGLIPLVGTDRGEYVFGVVDAKSGEWAILACDGDEQDFHEYRISFSEWLYRYLLGEDMFGPDSSVFYPGPVVFESMPMTATERSITWRGPDRNAQ